MAVLGLFWLSLTVLSRVLDCQLKRMMAQMIKYLSSYMRMIPMTRYVWLALH